MRRRAAPGLRYANLAVRSRRIEHIVADQIPRAIELRADLVSVLVGGNDLVKLGADPLALASRLGDGIRQLRASGCEVLLVTPFLPRRRASLLLAKRFALFNSELRILARTTGAVLLDLETVPEIGDLSLWADDAVHLNPRGHQILAYERRRVSACRTPNPLAASKSCCTPMRPKTKQQGHREQRGFACTRCHGRFVGFAAAPLGTGASPSMRGSSPSAVRPAPASTADASRGRRSEPARRTNRSRDCPVGVTSGRAYVHRQA